MSTISSDLSQIKISIKAKPEDRQPDEMNYEPEVTAGFYRMIDKHGLWGWCHVTVEARYGSFVGRDTLGACSYKSEADFIAAGDYYRDMVDQAIRELKNSMRKAQQEISEATFL